MSDGWRSAALHGAVLAILIAGFFVLPAYHEGALARSMVLAVFAMGFNLVFGYTGLLSLGHALFFAAGMYGLGLTMAHGGLAAAPALIVGVICGGAAAGLIGALALRTQGVAFMIVTLMFAQAGFLTALYFGEWTRGDEGFVIAQGAREIGGVALSDADARYLAALALFAVVFVGLAFIVRSGFGRALVAIRENEERATMLGYDVKRLKLQAMVLSGALSGLAGAAYALLFGYVGATFASVQYSILPLLWVLLGGAGTTIGPLIGTVLMFYLIDFTSGLTSAYLLFVGLALVLLTLFAPQGVAGLIRRRLAPWLP
ncbi:MAG: branched-chain amino acid ABC transporter permease [Pseudomonadota bacterium]